MLPFVVIREGVTLRLHTFGIQLDQLLRHLTGGSLDSALGVLPFLGAEAVQLHAAVLLGTYIFRYKIELGHGDIQVVALGVLDHDIIL